MSRIDEIRRKLGMRTPNMTWTPAAIDSLFAILENFDARLNKQDQPTRQAEKAEVERLAFDSELRDYRDQKGY